MPYYMKISKCTSSLGNGCRNSIIICLKDTMNTIIDGSLCHGYHYRMQVINFGQEAKGVD